MNPYNVAITSDYLAALFAERAESAKRVADLERELAEVKRANAAKLEDLMTMRNRVSAALRDADDLRNDLLTAHAMIATLVEYGASLENKIVSAAQALAE